MSQKYLTIVYAVNETSDVAANHRAREWIASSYSHAIDDVRALKKENANLRTDYDAVLLEIASLQAQEDAKDAARWRWIANYLIGNDTSKDDDIVACKTVSQLAVLADITIATQPR